MSLFGGGVDVILLVFGIELCALSDANTALSISGWGVFGLSTCNIQLSMCVVSDARIVGEYLST